MTKSKIFLYFCLSFIGGIFLNSIVKISQPALLGFLILGILLISVLWSHKKLVVIGFCLLFLVVGIWRHQTVELEIMNNELRGYNNQEEQITLIGRVIKEPDIRETNTKLTIEAQSLNGIKIKGKVLITTNRYPQYQYGDKLKITGKLLTPQVFEDFNYKDYLAKEGIYSAIYWPEIELIEKESYTGPTWAIYGQILKFKNKLRESIYQNLSSPQSSILGAMILGDKKRMTENLKEKLNIAGVRHITAISGMHITILSIILMQILIGLGLWRNQAFYLTIALLILFIIMVGLPPSAIRAGLMGGLFLMAQKIGRLSSASRTIVMAATGMVAVNPLLLRLDVGFQLSFLAVMGIIYLGPIFRNWLRFIPEGNFINLRSIISMTLSAQIFTLPILVYNFGRISSVAPITNILILPLLYWIMILGFIFALLGILWQGLGWILSWPVWVLLTYLLTVINWFSQPWAAKTFENVHWLWLIISYLILGLITWRLNKSQKLKFLKY